MCVQHVDAFQQCREAHVRNLNDLGMVNNTAVTSAVGLLTYSRCNHTTSSTASRPPVIPYDLSNTTGQADSEDMDHKDIYQKDLYHLASMYRLRSPCRILLPWNLLIQNVMRSLGNNTADQQEGEKEVEKSGILNFVPVDNTRTNWPNWSDWIASSTF